VSDHEGGGIDQAMPDKRLMYKSSVVGYEADASGHPVEVSVLERWGKSKRRRARRRVLKAPDREYVSGGGYSYKTHGAIVHDGQVYEINEVSGERWWARPVEWGDSDE